MEGSKEEERKRGEGSKAAQRDGWKRTSEWSVGVDSTDVGRGEKVEDGVLGRRNSLRYEERQDPVQ